MSKIVSVMLEWIYSPETYFEEPISIQIEEGTLEIKNGAAIAIINPETFDANSLITELLTRHIESRLYAVQIMTHKDFNLSKPSRIDIREDGGKHYYVEVESCAMIMTMGSVDVVLKDKFGNVISDTRRERQDKERRFASLVDKHRHSDATLNQMLSSYRESVKDPDDELVHLYEIRDSLSNKFGSKKNAMHKLGITSAEWDEIGKLANTLPLKQGRHRGKAAGSLRNADLTELNRARTSTAYLIEKYLDFLEL